MGFYENTSKAPTLYEFRHHIIIMYHAFPEPRTTTYNNNSADKSQDNKLPSYRCRRPLGKTRIWTADPINIKLQRQRLLDLYTPFTNLFYLPTPSLLARSFLLCYVRKYVHIACCLLYVLIMIRCARDRQTDTLDDANAKIKYICYDNFDHPSTARNLSSSVSNFPSSLPSPSSLSPPLSPIPPLTPPPPPLASPPPSPPPP
jgi:hypothetical protein